MLWPEVIMLGLYFVILLLIGVYFYRGRETVNGYYLGSKGLGHWVTALSAQASDMSGWLLMGLPGAIYIGGPKGAAIAFGLMIGTYLNWRFLAPRIKILSDRYHAISVVEILASHFPQGHTGLRLITSLMILFFFTAYCASGFVAAAKVFESIFLLPYEWGLVISSVVLIFYTLFGGYLAVCWTDLFQGCLMFVVLAITPLMILGLNPSAPIEAAQIKFNGEFTWIGACSAMAWGLGYFGQPHILARFMSIREAEELTTSRRIAMGWLVLTLGGSVLVGLWGRTLLPDLVGSESEKIFILLSRQFFNAWFGGIILAAILSAIMSTISSQLLISGQTLSDDLIKRLFHIRFKRPVLFARAGVLILALLSLWMARDPHNSILDLVAYAWGGLGATLGPALLLTLSDRKISGIGVALGMVIALLTILAWRACGLHTDFYEIVPAMMANFVTVGIYQLLTHWRSGDK